MIEASDYIRQRASLARSARAERMAGLRARIAAERAAGETIECFTPGLRVTTRSGKVAVEHLRPGDMLLTRDRGFQPLLWRGVRRLRPEPGGPGGPVGPGARGFEPPVRIRAGALGPGQPERDMVVSPGHRLLTTDPALLARLGAREALVEARMLLGAPGVERLPMPRVTYIHLLLESHEVILCENTWSESFCLTPQAARALRGLAGGLPSGGASLPAQRPARPCLAAAKSMERADSRTEMPSAPPTASPAASPAALPAALSAARRA
ncbi:MAG: Hint domain-containing protein [Roseovarius sp.]